MGQPPRDSSLTSEPLASGEHEQQHENRPECCLRVPSSSQRRHQHFIAHCQGENIVLCVFSLLLSLCGGGLLRSVGPSVLFGLATWGQKQRGPKNPTGALFSFPFLSLPSLGPPSRFQFTAGDQTEKESTKDEQVSNTHTEQREREREGGRGGRGRSRQLRDARRLEVPWAVGVRSAVRRTSLNAARDIGMLPSPPSLPSCRCLLPLPPETMPSACTCLSTHLSPLCAAAALCFFSFVSDCSSRPRWRCCRSASRSMQL